MILNWIGRLFLLIPGTSFHGYPNEDRERYYFYYDIRIGDRDYEVFSHSRKVKHRVFNRSSDFVD